MDISTVLSVGNLTIISSLLFASKCQNSSLYIKALNEGLFYYAVPNGTEPIIFDKNKSFHKTESFLRS
jgi:hypothetical protein